MEGKRRSALAVGAAPRGSKFFPSLFFLPFAGELARGQNGELEPERSLRETGRGDARAASHVFRRHVRFRA